LVDGRAEAIRSRPSMNTASTWGTAQEGWRKKLDRVGQGAQAPFFMGAA